jgi:hypothetical protein
MNREDIIRMAREADFKANVNEPYNVTNEWVFRFAALVASAERSACAKVCDGVQDCGPENGCCPTYWNESLERAAAAIRARGQT